MINEIKKQYPHVKVVKKYPDSSQKWVYLAEMPEYGTVLIKIVKNMNERIRREIDIVSNNSIPGVPRVLHESSFTFHGARYHYFIEEYIKGEVLSDAIKNGAMDVGQSLTLIEDLLVIVSTLEEIGIVHRDIKPDNIIFGDDGHFHLIDFGIARNLNLTSLTLTEAEVGPHTPGYGAPELFQYSKAQINSKADLFSIGVVAYQCIFGKHPFLSGHEADLNEIWYKTTTVTPQNFQIEGDVDGQLYGLIKTMMQKQVTKRPPSARKALEWLRVIKQTILLK